MIKPAYEQPINQSTYDQTILFFENLMKVLHPFMPFVTEELWQNMTQRKAGDSICISSYPIPNQATLVNLDRAFETITKIRELRNAYGISPKEAFDIAIKTNEPNGYVVAENIIKKLGNVTELLFVSEKTEGATAIQVATDEVYVQLNIEIDAAVEKEKLTKELAYLEGFLISVDTKLSNERFVANAKPELVEKERQKRADAVAKIEIIKGGLLSL
jgi:valyl-tRNA synthetase